MKKFVKSEFSIYASDHSAVVLAVKHQTSVVTHFKKYSKKLGFDLKSLCNSLIYGNV